MATISSLGIAAVLKPLGTVAEGPGGRVGTTWRTVCACILWSSACGGPATAAVPSPWEPGNPKAGQVRPVEQLSKEERIVRYEYEPDRPYPEHLKFGEYWQDPKMCGPNALYVLLKLQGVSATRDEVVKLVPVGPHGSTLADLSQAATQLGLKHRLQKVSPRELRQLSPPILVHENIRSMQPDQPDEGHFFVVVAFQEPDRVKVIDGVSGFYQQTDKERLSRSLSGYVLVPETRVAGVSTRWLWGLLYALVAVIAGLGVTLLIMSMRYGQRREFGQLVQHA